MQIVSCVKLWISSNLIGPQNGFYSEAGDVTGQHVVARLVKLLRNRQMLVSSSSIYLSRKLLLWNPFILCHSHAPAVCLCASLRACSSISACFSSTRR